MANKVQHRPGQDDEAARKDMTAVLPSVTGVLTIDLGAIQRNYRTLCKLVAPAECAGVVKADAYGLGLRHVVPALAAAGCTTFFVATLAEARVLREVERQAALYVLDGLFPGTAAAFHAIDARPVLSSLDELAEWEVRIADFRVFYDVDEENKLVKIAAVGYKEGSQLFIRGEEYKL